MKKFLVVLLILVLIGPVIGYCGCCSPVSHEQTKVSRIEHVTHNCCSSFNVQKNVCDIEKKVEVLPTLDNFILSVSAVSDYISNRVDSGSYASSPPQFLTDIPLYLTNQVFRL